MSVVFGFKKDTRCSGTIRTEVAEKLLSRTAHETVGRTKWVRFGN